MPSYILAVYYGAKILILMQFTTICSAVYVVGSCLLWCKDTNFNAIHNGVLLSDSKHLLFIMVQRY